MSVFWMRVMYTRFLTQTEVDKGTVTASVRSGLVTCDPLVNQPFEQVEWDGAVFENDGVEVL